MTAQFKEIFGNTPLNSRLDFIQLSRKGLSVSSLNKIQSFTSLTNKELVQILPISERQLSRYKETHILKKDISSILIQIVELFEKGYEIFGQEKFKIWIRSEIRALNNIPPIQLLDTPIGIQLVADILGRIEHGVYS